MGALCLAAAVALAGCGTSDEEEANEVVKQFVQAAGKRDAAKFCGELVTEDFLKRTTGVTGKKARSACRQQIGQLQGRIDLKLVRIDKTTIKDDRATVRATLKVQRQQRPQVFELKKEDGDWRLAAGGG